MARLSQSNSQNSRASRMSRLSLPSLALGAVFVFASVGCGGSSNFNQIWGKDDGGDTLYVEARAAYDRGDFDEAEKKVNKLLARNPDNETAAVLLGYIALSQGNIDPYTLARALISLESDKTAAGGSGLQDPPADDSEKKSSDAASTLQSLSTLINLDEADFVALSDGDFAGANIFKPATNRIPVPKKLTDELFVVDVLAKMNKALKAICRFVDPSVLTEDPRHLAADCEASTAPKTNSSKAHFLWAFTHLTEAIVYQSVLLYQSEGNTTTNFQTGSALVNNAVVNSAEELEQFVADVDEVTSAVDTVFDTSDGSMMQGMLRNLTAVNLAFAQLAGLPDKMKSRISNVLLKIEEVGKSFGGGDTNNLKALKGQLTEKFAKQMGSKIETSINGYLEPHGVTSYDEIDGSSTIPAGEKAELKKSIASMCTSYDNLTGSLDPAKKSGSKPASCP